MPGRWGVNRAWLVAAALAASLMASTSACAGAFSHAALDTLLARHLRHGRVDYRALARDGGILERYLAAAAEADPARWQRAEQIAVWVNVYNARVLEGVLRRPGIRSVLDTLDAAGALLRPFFEERRRSAGALRSLDDIERGILRARFHEPRVHFVLNCASMSCPELGARALGAATLEADLERATARFLADTTHNRIDPGRGLELSAVFQWYADDFRAAAGSLQGFIERHWPDRSARFAPGLPVRYLPYDWSLNGTW